MLEGRSCGLPFLTVIDAVAEGLKGERPAGP